MNLLTIEWQNRGINMWTIDSGTIDLVKGQTTPYDLPADTIDLLEHQIRTNSGNTSTQTDLTINRISVSTYASIPNKLTQGRPIQLYIERLRDVKSTYGPYQIVTTINCTTGVCGGYKTQVVVYKQPI
jgi:hypothetical protein